MKSLSSLCKRSHLAIVAGALLITLATTGCSGAGAESTAASDASNTESTELGLHAVAGVPLLSWRGKPPEANQQNSNQTGLNVAYGLSIGVTTVSNVKLVTALQVCWYTPSNANNIYTTGDPLGCTAIGNQTAGSWTTQQCGTNEVVSGYRVGLSRDGGHIGKLATICRSLTSPSSTRTFGFAGDQGILFLIRSTARASSVERPMSSTFRRTATSPGSPGRVCFRNLPVDTRGGALSAPHPLGDRWHLRGRSCPARK
jgi:hypothetical protein